MVLVGGLAAACSSSGAESGSGGAAGDGGAGGQGGAGGSAQVRGGQVRERLELTAWRAAVTETAAEVPKWSRVPGTGRSASQLLP